MRLVLCILLFATSTGISAESDHTPEAALAAIQLADDDLKVELVASEPTIVDPVAARFDERGRLWVVEMRDYPTGPPASEDPNGRIVILTDTDHDGFFESSTTFADNLLFPTGLQPWKGGAFVTLAGEIAYFKDIDGDGVSDGRETWFVGFHEGNEQLRANHPTLGPDGLIYVACGLRGGTIKDDRPAHDGSIAVSVNGRDFRFDPRGDRFEAIAGHGQFGLTFDDFGRRFVCMNARPLTHVVMEEATLARNPYLADSTTVEHIIPGGQTEPVYPLVEQWTTSTFHKGSWTAACGVHIHRGTALGDAFRGNAFICEPTGSLVHREILIDDGPTFRGKPAYENREFLASTDPWFRPVNLFDGPDGALYVVDMARKEIEHPQWMPKEAVDRADFVSGNSLGRIYRIRDVPPQIELGSGVTTPYPSPWLGFSHHVPADGSRLGPTKGQSLGHKSTIGEVERVAVDDLTDSDLYDVLLTTPSSWFRDTAFRLILERGATLPVRARLAHHVTPAGAVAELRLKTALGMDAVGGITPDLSEAEARLAEAASMLAQPQANGELKFHSRLIALTLHPDAKTRFQAAIALGRFPGEASTIALASLSVRDGDNPWMRRAILSSIHGAELDFASRILDESDNAELIEAAFALATRAAKKSKQADHPDATQIAQSIVDSTATNAIKQAALLGVATATNRADAYRLLDSATELREQLVTDALEALRTGDEKAAEFVGWYHPPSDAWAGVLTEPIATEARSSLVARLALRSDFPSEDGFLEALGEMPPALRASILNAMQARPPLAKSLLAAAQSGVFPVSLIDNTTSDRLRKHRDKSVASLAAEVLPKRNTDRVALIDEYKPCLELDCEIGSGAAAFKKHCATCHRLGDEGGNVGPDLSDLRTKTPDQLLQAILDPNAAIDANYINHTAITLDGQVASGLLVSQSESAVTLRGTDAKDLTILRTDLESIAPTGQSIMPEGLERQLDQQAMADVIYYLKNYRYVQNR